MILDDLVREHPHICNLIKDAHCISVPWRIWPESAFINGTHDWDKEHDSISKLVPEDDTDSEPSQRDGVKKAISWKEIAIPYEQVLIISQIHKDCVWVVNVYGTPKCPPYQILTMVYVYNSVLDRYMAVPFSTVVRPTGFISPVMWDDLPKDIQEETLVWYEKWYGSMMSREKAHSMVSQTWSEEAVPFYNMIAMRLSAFAALLSCKNIKLEAVEHPKKLQQSRIRKGKLPLYRYHILKVTNTVKHSDGRLIGQGGDVAVHWVRGHFKRYTEQNKLFGKHTGLYWWQPHIAGTSERVVEKDYELQVGVT